MVIGLRDSFVYNTYLTPRGYWGYKVSGRGVVITLAGYEVEQFMGTDGKVYVSLLNFEKKQADEIQVSYLQYLAFFKPERIAFDSGYEDGISSNLDIKNLVIYYQHLERGRQRYAIDTSMGIGHWELLRVGLRGVRCVNDGQVYKSANDAATHYGIPQPNLQAVLKMKRETVNDLIFEYI